MALSALSAIHKVTGAGSQVLGSSVALLPTYTLSSPIMLGGLMLQRRLFAGAVLFCTFLANSPGQNAAHVLEKELIGSDREIWEAIAASHPDIDQVSAALAPDYIDIDSGVRHSREEVLQYLQGLTRFSFQYEYARLRPFAYVRVRDSRAELFLRAERACGDRQSVDDHGFLQRARAMDGASAYGDGCKDGHAVSLGTDERPDSTGFENLLELRSGNSPRPKYVERSRVKDSGRSSERKQVVCRDVWREGKARNAASSPVRDFNVHGCPA